jgi:flagellar hook-associated protein 1 FlgK
MAVHRAATAVASHNLENANTPGYARQRAELVPSLPAEDTGHGNLGRGVSLLNITQSRDQFLENQMPGALGDKARSSAEADTLEGVSALDPDSANGLTAALGNFYGGLRTLSQNPGDRGSRQAAVAAGQSLSLAFNRASTSLETARTGVDAQVVAAVGDINRAATAIAELNKSIRQAMGSESIPNDLLDARQRHLDTLAQLTGAKAVDTGTGTVNVVLPNGTPLVVEFRAATASAVPNNTNGGHVDFSVAPAGSNNSAVVPVSNIGGKVAGLLDARDVGLGLARTQLDQLAYDFTQAFNNVHVTGYGLDGVNGRNFFTPQTQVAGSAAAMAVDPWIVANPSTIAAADGPLTVPGDGTNLLEMIASEDTVLGGGATVGQTLGTIVSDYGSRAAQARARFEQDDHALSHLEGLRESVSGVSIDEELVNLTKSQRAFEAVMKVITTADKMLESLMSIR